MFLVVPTLFARAQVPFAFSCGEDDHIDITKRKAIDLAAKTFVDVLLGSNPGSSWDSLSKPLQQKITRQDLATSARGLIQIFQPKNPTVKHTYLIELKGTSPGRVVCAADLSKPDGWESLSAVTVPEQAHVALSAETRNNQIAFTIWLVPEDKVWRVQSFWMNLSTLGNKGPTQLWELARAQQRLGHELNAALLYASAAQIANRGPDFQMGITQSISRDMAQVSPPREIQGQPPFLWKGKADFKILSLGPIAIGGKIDIMINHETGPWKADAEVDGWNKELIAYFKRRFPEYSDSFAGIIVHAKERGSNREYGTVEESSSSK